MSPSLHVVPAEPKPETVAEKVRRLQAEAKQLARDHVQALTVAIAEAQWIAAEIADGGDAYPAGIRDLARRFAEDAEPRALTLQALNSRNS